MNPPTPLHAGTPPADVRVDTAVARALLARQHPDLADLPLVVVAEGWDNLVLRLGARFALRLPRRQVGARLIAHEQRWLPELAGRLPLQVPTPLRIGAAQADYPYPWSIVPWLEGETADLAPPGPDQGEALAAFFAALHRPAPADAPDNPVRGVPLASRREVFEGRAQSLARRGEPPDPRLRQIWDTALAAPDDTAATWIHGDPHPRNVLVRSGRLSAVIDWGDLARGDRASDLAGLWMLLPGRQARERAMAALTDVSAGAWARARGWAALYVVMLLDAGLADDPRMAAIARRTFAALVDGP
jgi:aminoglycoside phosphotransferase (APT) family kinase protein